MYIYSIYVYVYIIYTPICRYILHASIGYGIILVSIGMHRYALSLIIFIQ